MPTADEIRSRLKNALTTAMKARERDVVSALRSAISAIDNAEAVTAPTAPAPDDAPIAGALTGLGAGEAARRDLTVDDITAIVEAEIADLRQSADDYDRLGQDDRAAALRTGATALAAVLAPET